METEPPAALDILGNHLLACLSAATRDRLRPHLRWMPLLIGDVIYEERTPQKYVYFPTSGIVSLVYIMRDGATAEIAIIGSDGFIGFPGFLGSRRANSRAVVQVEGHAWRMRVNTARELAEVDPAFQKIVLRYIQLLLTQMAQTAVCNRHHTITQQLARWILHSLDRIDTNKVCMTQQLVADMLGVRREGISAVARELKLAGVIDYSRGQIFVLDRNGLESRACECYGMIVEESNRLLPKSG